MSIRADRNRTKWKKKKNSIFVLKPAAKNNIEIPKGLESQFFLITKRENRYEYGAPRDRGDFCLRNVAGGHNMS